MDQNSRANASIARQLAAAARPAATCKDCGTNMVAWVQSKRTGKWYLADATFFRGDRLPMAHRPHFKTCPGKQSS